MVDYLFIASKFNHYAGPNNHLLDLSNYLFKESGKQLVLLTHSYVEESDFSREIEFPILRTLQKPPHVISNITTIRDAIQKCSPRKVFVNSDVNLAFQTYFATRERLLAGYNIFQPGAKFSLNRSLGKMLYYNLLTCEHWLGPKILVKKILAHTKLQKKDYIRVGIKPDKIAVIPHCVSLERIYKALKKSYKHEKDAVPTIAFVGRLVKHKGILELLKVYKQITMKTDAKLMIVGSGPLEEQVNQMKKHIEKENRKARITFSKRVALSELMCLLNNADIMVIPSHYEPFGIIALEAMSLKKAVLATCFGGTSEIITDKVDGFLVNPWNSKQFKSRLEELISNRSEREQLGNEAYQTVKDKYDVTVVAPRFVSFLDSS